MRSTIQHHKDDLQAVQFSLRLGVGGLTARLAADLAGTGQDTIKPGVP